MIVLPVGWKVIGSMLGVPLRDWDDVELKEDIVAVVPPSGHNTLDVGWYPEGDVKGEFCCRWIFKDWETPLEECHTRDPRKVIEWLIDRIDQIAGYEPKAASSMAHVESAASTSKE